MFKKLVLSIVCSLVISLLAPVVVFADPVPKSETYWMISNAWKIIESNNKDASPVPRAPGAKSTSLSSPGFAVELQEGGRPHRFPVNILSLAHNTNSESIATGNYQLSMREYLKGLKLLKDADALVKLSSVKPNGSLEVVGIWLFNSNQAWKKATSQGSQILNLNAAEVQRYASAEGYKSELVKRTKAQWIKINARK